MSDTNGKSVRHMLFLACSECRAYCDAEGKPTCTCLRDHWIRGCVLLFTLAMYGAATIGFALWVLCQGLGE